jgi:hypothetical protein
MVWYAGTRARTAAAVSNKNATTLPSHRQREHRPDSRTIVYPNEGREFSPGRPGGLRRKGPTMLVIFALAALLFGGTVAPPVAPTSFDVVTGGPSHR